MSPRETCLFLHDTPYRTIYRTPRTLDRKTQLLWDKNTAKTFTSRVLRLLVLYFGSTDRSVDELCLSLPLLTRAGGCACMRLSPVKVLGRRQDATVSQRAFVFVLRSFVRFRDAMRVRFVVLSILITTRQSLAGKYNASFVRLFYVL